MSNSSLVNYIQISPNRHSPRRHAIDTITIHCVVGQASVEALGNLFGQAKRQASSNYGIGFDGKIGMYCEEKDRSWCSSSADNDNRAITIECASDDFAPYAINDKVWNSLINLCADICFRNKIPKLLWKGDKNLIGKVDQQNITAHRWFAVTECPGDYIYDRLGQIADEVNAKLDILNGVKKKTVAELAQEVIAGKWGVDPERTKKLTEAGYDAAAVQKEVDILMGKKIPEKPVEKKTNMAIAEEVVAGKWGVEPERSEKLKAAGYDPAVVQKGVNALMGVSNATKSNMEIAEEVVAGKWGVDPERTKKLTEAGYDAKLVQKGVNALMGISNARETTTTPAKKTNFELAQEVIAGKWGVDPDRKKKLTEAGYDAAAVQKEVDILLGKTVTTKAMSEVKASGYAEKFNPVISNTYTVKTALNMRDKANKSSKVLVVAPKGTKVQCFGYYTYAGGVNWYYVTATIGSTKYTGFMDSTYFY